MTGPSVCSCKSRPAPPQGPERPRPVEKCDRDTAPYGVTLRSIQIPGLCHVDRTSKPDHGMCPIPLLWTGIGYVPVNIAPLIRFPRPALPLDHALQRIKQFLCPLG